MPNGLDPDQDRLYVGTDLGQNCKSFEQIANVAASKDNH